MIKHRRATTSLSVLGLALAPTLALWASTDSWADGTGPAYRRFRGQIVYQASPFSSFSTDDEFLQTMRRASKKASLERDEQGGWSFHFLAFLKQPTRSEKLNLVWYKILGKKLEQVDYTEYVIKPDQLIFSAQAQLGAEQFKAGDRLEARITRVVGGKELVYARARVLLK